MIDWWGSLLGFSPPQVDLRNWRCHLQLGPKRWYKYEADALAPWGCSAKCWAPRSIMTKRQDQSESLVATPPGKTREWQAKWPRWLLSPLIRGTKCVKTSHSTPQLQLLRSTHREGRWPWRCNQRCWPWRPRLKRIRLYDLGGHGWSGMVSSTHIAMNHKQFKSRWKIYTMTITCRKEIEVAWLTNQAW